MRYIFNRIHSLVFGTASLIGIVSLATAFSLYYETKEFVRQFE